MSKTGLEGGTPTLNDDRDLKGLIVGECDQREPFAFVPMNGRDDQRFAQEGRNQQ
jgi:hypothetical protein